MMIRAATALVMSGLLLSACSTGGTSGPSQTPTGEVIGGPDDAAGISLTREEAVSEMVNLGCDVGFGNFPQLGSRPSDCATFILSVASDGGVDPAAYQQAREDGRSEVASQAVRYAWDETWVAWLAGASLVCEQTRSGPQSRSDQEVTLAALEVAVPGLSERVYAQAQAVFCPALPAPAPEPAGADMTVRAAIDAVCRTAISQLPDLVDAGDSAYWTEVVQVLTAAEGIPVGPIDGQYGPQTIAGVKELQRIVGVVDDGQVGPLTWTAIQGYFC